MNDNNNRWLKLSEAAQEFGVSERTLQRWISSDKAMSKLERGRRLILASSVADAVGTVGDMSQLVSEGFQEENDKLKEQIATLKEELERQKDTYRQQMAELSEKLHNAEKKVTLTDELMADKERLHRQLEVKDEQIRESQKALDHNQQLLAYAQLPWWRKLGRKALPAAPVDMKAENDEQA